MAMIQFVLRAVALNESENIGFDDLMSVGLGSVRAEAVACERLEGVSEEQPCRAFRFS